MEKQLPVKTETEKVYEGNVEIHQRLLARFIAYDNENKEDASPATMDYLIKLAGSIGYSQQVHAGLVKAYHHEKRLAEIEEILKNKSSDVEKPKVWGK